MEIDDTVTTLHMKVPIASEMLKDARADLRFQDALIELILASCTRQLKEALNDR